jgi:hypothetical protein
MDIVDLLVSYWWLIITVGLLFSYKLVLRVFGIVIIPNDSIGILNKRFRYLRFQPNAAGRYDHRAERRSRVSGGHPRPRSAYVALAVAV